jgi:hypothetical protein
MPISEERRRAEVVARAGLSLLSNVDDPSAAGALRAALRHREPRVRAAALQSLGWSGGEGDVPAAIAALGDEDPGLRRAGRWALGELGGSAAADALAGALTGTEGRERGELIESLAWLRDPRALVAAREMSVDPATNHSVDYAFTVSALVRLGNAEDRERLRELLLSVADQPRWYLAMLVVLRRALAEHHPEEAEQLEAWVAARASSEARRRITGSTYVEVEPLEPRTVPRMTLVELHARPVDDAWPPPKFGGRPDWVEAPAWPHTPSGRPMTFYGQLPALTDPPRTAYIFISMQEAAATWELFGADTAVILQPDGRYSSPVQPLSTGPRLYVGAPRGDRLHPPRIYVPYERFVRLEPGADPPQWTWPELPEFTYMASVHGDHNKIGGTPIWIQGDPELDRDGWRNAFQFDADWAGCELSGNGAVCHGFVRDDGSAAFMWE